jgi:predicted lysophospholipase L1 biosynthesis ABC-type transport system permease subunit
MASKPKLTGLGLALGAALGTVVGVLAGHMGVWLAIGVAIGVAIGATFRTKAMACPECEALHRTHEAVTHASVRR